MSTKEELLKRLSEGVLEMEEDDVAEAAQEYIDAGYPALDAINQGLIDGMNQASELFEEEEYFVTDLLLCSDAMYAGINVLRPYLPEEKNDVKHKCVIGVVEGDTHDIGKNLVKIMLETAGFEMIDLGGMFRCRSSWYREGKRSRIDLPVYADDNYHAWNGRNYSSAGKGRSP